MANVLTAAEITAILASGRNRGGHERMLRKFHDSGEMYITVNELPEYSEKVKANLVSVKNTLQMKAKALELPIRLMKYTDDEGNDNLIAINTDMVVVESEDSEEA